MASEYCFKLYVSSFIVLTTTLFQAKKKNIRVNSYLLATCKDAEWKKKEYTRTRENAAQILSHICNSQMCKATDVQSVAVHGRRDPPRK